MPAFYRLPFTDVGEGANLVAALSRQICSPRVDLGDVGPIEVGIFARGEGADVYASAGALTAISRAFATPPNVVDAESVPDGVVWILRDGEKRFLGRDDVLGKIVPEPADPMHTMRTSVGVVKFWRDEKGYGVIEVPEIRPWSIWTSFFTIELDGTAGGFRSLDVGDRVEVRYYRGNQQSYRYVAEWVRRIRE